MNPFGNFTRLTQFTGGEPRRRFWPYVGIVMVVFLFVAPAVVMLTFTPLFGDLIDTANNTGLDSSSTEAANDRFVLWMFVAILADAALLIGLLAAAVARRLRDGGVPARWGLLPIPFILCSTMLFGSLFAIAWRSDALKIAVVLGAVASNMAYLASLVFLIVLLCRPTRPGSPLAPAPA